MHRIYIYIYIYICISWEHDTFFYLDKIGCKSFVSIDAYCKASLIRTASKTIKGWEPLLSHLQLTARDHLDIFHFCKGDLCTRWWDTKPFVHYLACAYYGSEDFEVYQPCCAQIQSIQSDPAMQKSIQRIAHHLILTHNGGYNFYPLLFRRSQPLGFMSNVIISSSDINSAFQCARNLPKAVAMAWLKTVTNAWCTSSRMHEPV